MKKVFIKSISALLAVIIGLCSVPFCAFAAPGNYNPDIEIIFYPVWTNDYFDYSDQTGAKRKKVDYHVTDGPADAALDYNSLNGTLKYSKNKFKALFKKQGLNINQYFPRGDRTLGVGDYFAATVVCKNISKLFALQAVIKYSDNITPAGINVTTSGSGINKTETASLTTNKNASAFYGCYNKISGETYYGLDTEMNEIDKHNNMFIACCGDTPYSDVSSVKKHASDLTNPSDGSLGYSFKNTAILATFIFKITGKGAIRFSAADPNNKLYKVYGGGFYAANNSETNVKSYTTLASQPGCPGSGKMTFFKNLGSQAYAKEANSSSGASASALKTPVIKKLKSGKKKAKIYWKRVNNAKAYEIQYSTDKSFKNAKTVKADALKASLKIKKLKAKKVYYFRIRAVKGKSASAWSKAKQIKTK